MRSAALMLALLTSSTAAHAGRVSVEVLTPAQVDVPTAVHRVAVVDRSAARNAGQALLGTLEGAVTGEGIRGDRDAARDAVQTMIAQLQASPRFEVVLLDASKKELQSSLWDKGMSAELARDLCARRCDGIVSLEAFDSDNNADGVGVRSGRGVATWRFYDGRTGAVLDSERQNTANWGASGGGVLIDMALNNDQVARMGQASAMAYASRIAPTWQWERRKLFGSSRGLRQGLRHAKAGDWAGAIRTWEAVAAQSTGKRKGKAQYNLAVALEAQGELDQAIAMSSIALASLNNGAARRLSLRLRVRQGEADRLDRQLAGR